MPKKYSNPIVIFRCLAVKQIIFKLKELFNPPFYYKLEVGKAEKLHIHLIAEKDAGLNELPRKTERIKEGYNFEGLVRYLSKPNVAYSEQSLNYFQTEKRRLNKLGRKRFPRTSGYVFS